jgi:hypothetical protein
MQDPNPLTAQEHADAQVAAYNLSLKRGGNVTPAYDPVAAGAEFGRAAAELEFNKSAFLDVFEMESENIYRDGLVPVTLKKFPKLRHRDRALDEFLTIHASLSDEQYWSLLGHVWVFAPKTPDLFDYRYSQEYAILFDSERPGRKFLMTPAEAATFAIRKDPLVVYRGCAKDQNDQTALVGRSRKTLRRDSQTRSTPT